MYNPYLAKTLIWCKRSHSPKDTLNSEYKNKEKNHVSMLKLEE
jgi:hypothetical protein